MSDLDEIIELGTTPDSRLPEGPPVDTSSRSDLDIVLNDDVPQRMNSNDFGVEVSDFAGLANGFNAPGLTRHKRKSISADRRIGLNYDSAADLAPIADANAGVKQRMVTDCDIRPDVDVGDKPTMIADPAVWTNPAKWTNRGVLADAGRSDQRQSMDESRARSCTGRSKISVSLAKTNLGRLTTI